MTTELIFVAFVITPDIQVYIEKIENLKKINIPIRQNNLYKCLSYLPNLFAWAEYDTRSIF